MAGMEEWSSPPPARRHRSGARAPAGLESLDIGELCPKMLEAMVLAILLVLSGLALCGYGVVLASKMRRPIDLLGALLAALGLGAAMLGAGRLLSQRFFSG
jgi:hypothetical protein